MSFPPNCIYRFLFLLLTIPIAALVLQPPTNNSEVSARAELSGIETRDNAIGLPLPPMPGPLTNWCRPPNSLLDLHYSTSKGKPLRHQDVLWAVGVLREVTEDQVKVLGKTAHVDTRLLKSEVKDIVISIFDEKLMDRTWEELYDVMDTLLLCTFQQKLAAEFHGIFFRIATWQKFAGIMVRQALKPQELSEGIVTTS